MPATARTYLEMIKFGHTIFALPFALAALAIATARLGGVRAWDVVGVLACMVFARSTAMGFNRYADRDLDAANPRTAGRALPAGLLSSRNVLLFTIASALLFVLSTGCFYLASGNWLPAAFAIPLLAFLCGYSYAKRFTALAHLWLGAALAASPVAVWVALLPPGGWLSPFLLAGAVATWVAGFDIVYALQDVDVDRKLGLHSIPARLGRTGAMNVARLLHAATLALLVAFGWWTPELGVRLFFGCGFAIVAALLIFEHLLVHRRKVEEVLAGFFRVNGAIGVVLLIAVLLDLAFGPMLAML